MSVFDGRSGVGDEELEGFQIGFVEPPASAFANEVRASVLQELEAAVGAEDADEQLSRPGADDLLSAVAGWYQHRYGLAPAGSAEYEIEVAGVASLLAPQLADVPARWSRIDAGVPYPSAASVLGFS